MDDPRSLNSLWSLPLLCLGLGIIAICILVPAAEVNKRLTADRDKLNRDLATVESQVAANQAFLDEVGTDPEIAERLAQRQLRQIRSGTRVLELKSPAKNSNASVAEMISVPAPPPVNAYQPLTGYLGDICGNSRKQIYAVAIGLLMVAVSLVLSGPDGPKIRSTTFE
jgi:hypothetical protein